MRFEHWLYTLPLRLRSLFRRRKIENELDEELRYHLDQRVTQEIAKGANAEDASYAALCAMQGLEQRKEECRDARGVNFAENLARDLRFALRMLRKNPIFSGVALLSLALGIGANIAVFSLIDTLLLRPLPVPQPERLVNIFALTGNPHPRNYFTYAIFDEIRRQNHVFSSVFTWADHRFQMRSGPDMIHIDGMLASGDYFTGLGVAPALGRTFTPADDTPAGGKNGPVAVISDSFWSRQFQHNPRALGSALTLDGIPFTIVGIMPRSFFGAEVGDRPDVWVPLWFAKRIRDSGCIDSRSCWWLIIMARLKPGVSAMQAQAHLDIISPEIMRNTLPPNLGPAGQAKFKQWQLYTAPGANGWTSLRKTFSNPLAVLMILVALVLLIACANMANLLLARASARHREIAVRLGLGAGRSRIIRQLLTESLLLSLLGGVAGLLFAQWATRALIAFLASKQHHMLQQGHGDFELYPDWRIVLFTFLAALACGLLFGLAPALRATRLGIAPSLKERAHNLQGDAGRIGIGKLILAFQVALSILLVAGAGLFAGSLFRLLTQNLGFNPKNLVLIGIDTDTRPEKGVALINLYSHLSDRVNALPGVRAASLLWFTPLSGGGWDENLVIPGRNDLSPEQRDTYLNAIGPRFFEAMEAPVLSGREFTSADTASSEKVGILNELAARRFFPNQNPVGLHFILEKTPIRIVGVVGNAKYLDLRDPEPLTAYIPYSQNPGPVPSLTFLIKTTAQDTPLYAEFRAALRNIAPDIPVGVVKTMQDQIDQSLGRERLMASLSVFFGVLALLLTSTGLFGILAYSVGRRTGEIGVRMALGAQRRDVIWLVLRETMAHVALGMGLGIIAVLFTGRLIATLLYGVRPDDPGNLILAFFALTFVAAAAAYLPARRASRLDPMLALREE